MVSTGHAWSAKGTRRAQASHTSRLQAGQATSRRFSEDKKRSIGIEIAKLHCSWFHHGGILPRLSCKPSLCDEEERDLAHVYCLHLPEQGMPQGSICSS